MAIRIKLSEKYTAAKQKRIGTYTVTRKWNFVDEKIARIAEKFDPKGNIYEISKSVSKPEELGKINEAETTTGQNRKGIMDLLKKKNTIEDIQELETETTIELRPNPEIAAKLAKQKLAKQKKLKKKK